MNKETKRGRKRQKKASGEGLEAEVMPRGGGEEGFFPEGLERCVRTANPLNDALFKKTLI